MNVIQTFDWWWQVMVDDADDDDVGGGDYDHYHGADGWSVMG